MMKGQSVALLATAVALGFRFVLDPLLGDHLPYVTFFVAVAVTTWYEDLGASITAAVLGGILSVWFFLPPRQSFQIIGVQHQVGLLTYAMVAFAFAFFGQAMRRAQVQAHASAALAIERQHNLETEIEERSRAENALRRSEAELSEFFEHASLGIHWVGPDGIILRVNQAELDLLGYSREEYIGHHIAEFHADQPVIEDILHRLTCGDTLREFPARLRCKNGSIRDVLINSNVRFENGRFIHTRCFTHDVTDRKRAEDRLILSEARTRAIFESALDALITMDAEGRIQDFNPAAERMFGYRQEEVLGRTVADVLIPERLRHAHEQGFRRFLETGQSTVIGRRIEMPALHADNTEIPVELSISVMRQAGRPVLFTAYVRDITDRLKAEATQRQLASVLDNSTDFIGMCDMAGMPFYVNKAGLQMVGLESLEQAQKIHVSEFFFPEDHNLITNEFLPAVLEKGDGEVEIRFRHFKTGAAVWMLYRVFALNDAKGQRIGLATVSRNISDRKATERATAHLAAIVRSSDDAIISKDLTGTVMTWNQAAERLFGYRADEMIGRPIMTLIPPDRTDEERRILEKISRGETIETYETIRRRKDGTHIHVSLTISPLLDPQGNVIGASKIARDITGRVEQEAIVAQSRERLRQALQYQEAIVSNMGEGLYTVNHQGLVVSMNHTAEKLFGWTKEELVGRKMHDATHYKHPDGRPFPAEDCAGLQVLRTGVSVLNREDVFIRKDGSFFDVVYSSSPIRSGGEITGLVVVFHDVTEQKRAEQALRDRDRALTAANDELNQQKAGLAEANKELQSFSYSVSHDLRAPLRTINAYVRIVEEDYGMLLDDELRRCLGIIKTAAGRAGQLIDDLLEFSRLGRVGMDLRPTKMTELAREAAAELTLADDRRAVDLTIGDLPLCNGDWRLLKLVWVNLLSNAFKFTRTRAMAHVEVGWLPDDRQPDACVYYVKDNGVGFDMKYVHKLFGVFQRLHLKDEFEGTGVGLAIVQRIVQRHGGRVWAEGKIDGGATFFFSLRKAMR
jgi:PAS domain S-box-containing protein